MSRPPREELWRQLRDRGLVEGELPPVGEARAPWFVRAMLGIAGWIGALFLLCFVALALDSLLKESGTVFTVGLLTCAAAAVMFRFAPRNDFVAQFVLAVSLAGQVMMLIGVSGCFEHFTTWMALYIAAQQAVLFFAVSNYVHRVWAAWTATLAVAYAMLDVGLFAFTPAVITGGVVGLALAEFKFARRGLWVRAGLYGLALAAVPVAILHGRVFVDYILDHHHSDIVISPASLWLGRAASLAVLVGAVAGVLRRNHLPLTSTQGRSALIGALLLGVVSIKAPGVGPAVAILLMGYANANRVLTGLGLFALIGYLSHYYYALGTTLLEKSGLLIAFGLALLLARLALKRTWLLSPVKNLEAPHA